MTIVESIANKLNIDSNELVHQGIRAYLENELKLVDTEIYKLASKYGVEDIDEFLKKVEAGEISEAEGYDDFFNLNNLLAHRENIIKSQNKLFKYKG